LEGEAGRLVSWLAVIRARWPCSADALTLSRCNRTRLAHHPRQLTSASEDGSPRANGGGGSSGSGGDDDEDEHMRDCGSSRLNEAPGGGGGGGGDGSGQGGAGAGGGTAPAGPPAGRRARPLLNGGGA
jgi:hypothetical protein